MPQIVRFPSADGTEIEAGLFFPRGKPPFRVAVYLHGGPHSRYSAEDDGYVRELLRRGYAVAAVDYRGSKGHGKAFEDALKGDIGNRDVEDVLAVVPALRRNVLFDASKIYLFGESYGGYLALMTATDPRNVFAAAASASGPTDMLRQFELLRRCKDPDCLRAYREMKADAGGDETTRRDFLIERSPVRRLERLKTPLLLLHGRKDKFCPVEQVVDFFQEARRLKKEVRLRVVEDVGHDLGAHEQRETFLDAVGDVAAFFDSK